MKIKNKKFIIVGGIPSPLGGVTVFLRRLLIRDQADILFLLDLYPGKKEPISPTIDKKIRRLKRPWRLFPWLTVGAFIYRKTPFFFNFSTPRALLLFVLIYKPKDADWRLMLHHGDLSIPTKLLESILFKKVLSKFNTIYVLSSSQELFYQSLKVGEVQIIRTKSYVPSIIEHENEDAKNKAKKLKTLHKTLFVMSGYPMTLYNYDRAISCFLNIREKQNGCLVIFIYGEGGLREELRNIANKQHNVYLLENENENYFNTFLKNSDCLLRLTSIDSFGISVADAISMGVTVLASDVSERFPGAHIISIDDNMIEKRLIKEYPNWSGVMQSKGIESTFVFSFTQSLNKI